MIPETAKGRWGMKWRERERCGMTYMGIKPLPKRSRKLASRNVFPFSAVTFHFERLSWEHLLQWTSPPRLAHVACSWGIPRPNRNTVAAQGVGITHGGWELSLSLLFFSACSWRTGLNWDNNQSCRSARRTSPTENGNGGWWGGGPLYPLFILKHQTLKV